MDAIPTPKKRLSRKYMDSLVNLAEPEESVQAVLGYLNFSSGSHDPHFFRHLNVLYQYCEHVGDSQVEGNKPVPLWLRVFQLLEGQLKYLQEKSSTFTNPEQATLVLSNTRDNLLPKYIEFHSDLLFHQSEAALFGPFFVGRVFEFFLICINQSPGWNSTRQNEIIDKLNDYIGYRPVAVLENDRKMQPYPHEWCCPIPLFIRDAGVAYGLYTDLINKTLEILRSVPLQLRSIVQFDLKNMKEMAVDPRPYDFDHPVNKRPNYQFGLWDPLSVDSRGFYSRFVVQQVTLDILLDRIKCANSEDQSQKLFESSAALAGTILMASAVSGHGPDAYTSDVTLGTLLPVIANFREAFYAHLIDIVSKDNVAIARNLVVEANLLNQPFGGVRRYLNAQLSRRRAQQLEHMHLAIIYAQIERSEAARRQASFVPATSTRILCALECLLTETETLLRHRQSTEAAANLEKSIDLIMRGIHCGAIVDPWNILGFDSNFSLFPALENSVPDHRIGTLIELIDRIFSQFSRTLCLAASEEQKNVVETISIEFNKFSLWWDQFAVGSVRNVDAIVGGSVYEDAQLAAKALAAWQQAGATSGDLRFWQPFVEQIDSPKGYVLIINALLDYKDFVAAMHLLMHWLSQSDQVNLQKGSDLFHIIANRWLNDVLNVLDNSKTQDTTDVWRMVEKFFDFLEANSGIYAQVPQWELINSVSELDENSLESESESTDGLYSAAYEEVVYRDSTDDGIDGEILGPDVDSFGLAEEAHRISERLGFMVTTTRLWKYAVVTALANAEDQKKSLRDRFISWLEQSRGRQKELFNLLKAIEMCDLPQPLPTSESLVEYDRNRAIHEVLIERVIDAYLADVRTTQILLAATVQTPGADKTLKDPMAFLVRAAIKGDIGGVQTRTSEYMKDLSSQNLLYIPVAKGGDLFKIIETKGYQRNLKMTLDILPRLGLLSESISLLRCSAKSEREQLGSAGCVTEFDQIFYVANQQMIGSIVSSVMQWPDEAGTQNDGGSEFRDQLLIDYLQQLVEHTAKIWLEHSQTLRLSVLEKVYSEKKWNALVNFIQAHGQDIFTQSFFHLGNLRAILHRGVSLWIEEKMASSEPNEWSIYSVMNTDENKRQIVEQLQIVIEAIVESYGEYREYNGTTTQSDKGELLYTFLDMLRLRSSYDRVAWNLIPAMQVHETLLRYGCVDAAEYWRLEMVERTRETADEIVSKLRELEQRYGMRLSTISNRLEERFIRPLEIGRAKILIRKCIDSEGNKQNEWFPLLTDQIDELSQEPTGAGLDLPQWIATLEEEIGGYKARHLRRIREDITQKITPRLLSREELEQQLQRLE